MKKELLYTVYRHISPSGKCYVGVTYQKVEDRWKSGGTGYKQHGQYKFWRAIKKYGWKNFKHEILETNIPADKIEEREQYWITFYDSFKNGYNATLGGKGALGHVPTKEARKKMGEKNIGSAHHAMPHSEESKKKMSIGHKGKHHSPATEFKPGCKAINPFPKGMIPWNKGRTDLGPSWNKGLKWSEETKRKISEAGKGRIPPNKGKVGKDCPFSKPVLQYDLQGNFIAEYAGVRDAARILGIDNTGISSCCRDDSKFYKDFVWRFKNGIIPQHIDLSHLKPKTRPVLQYDLNEKFMKEYESINEASRQTGINNGYIWRCCAGRRETGGGFIWKFKDK